MSSTSGEAFALILPVGHWHVFFAGMQFLLNSDHNPLTHLHSQKNPHRKFWSWISELEEFKYSIQYITGTNNIKGDALSRNTAACHIQPSPKFEGNIYAIFVNDDHFINQLKEEQTKDPYICCTKDAIHVSNKVTAGRLKRVQPQLQIIDGLWGKFGRPVLPHLENLLSLNIGYFGTNKVYTVLKERFYWPNMYQYVILFSTGHQMYQKSNCDISPQMPHC